MRPLVPALLLTSALALSGCASNETLDPGAGGSGPTEDISNAPATEAAPTPSAPASETVAPSPDPTAPEVPASPSPTASPVTDAPATEVPAGDCSAAGMDAGDVDFSPLPQEVQATATFLLDAALRCDEQLLATAAFESGTNLSFGDVDPYEFFGLPDEDGRYATLVTLLTRTRWAADPDDSQPGNFSWPRVHTSEWVDSDEAWQEVVDVGLLTAEQAADMRATDSGYLGWRVGIGGDGSWMFFVAGD